MPSLQDRFHLGPIHNPVRGALHVSASAVALGTAAHLWQRGTQGDVGLAALLVFAGSQAALFATSSLYHSVPWSPRWKRRMQRADHCMIYVAIAGTLTPIAVAALGATRAWPVLVGAWGIALCGVAQKLVFPSVHERASIPFQLAQASLGIPVLVAFAARHPGAPSWLALAGAAVYAVGAVAFLTERPRLWPRVFSFHELFHFMTVVGSGAHQLLVAQYLARGL